MNNFGPPGGFRRELNSAQIARTTARSLTASQSKRGPYILRILVMVAWHYPKELDGRAASLTRKQIRAMLKAIEMGMSKESVRKVETLALAKLVVLEGSKVRASAELLTDFGNVGIRIRRQRVCICWSVRGTAKRKCEARDFRPNHQALGHGTRRFGDPHTGSR